jgi:hypothetical protein
MKPDEDPFAVILSIREVVEGIVGTLIDIIPYAVIPLVVLGVWMWNCRCNRETEDENGDSNRPI